MVRSRAKVVWATDLTQAKRTAAMMVEDFGPAEAARLCTLKYEAHRQGKHSASREATQLQAYWVTVRKEILNNHGLVPRGGE